MQGNNNPTNQIDPIIGSVILELEEVATRSNIAGTLEKILKDIESSLKLNLDAIIDAGTTGANFRTVKKNADAVAQQYANLERQLLRFGRVNQEAFKTDYNTGAAQRYEDLLAQITTKTISLTSAQREYSAIQLMIERSGFAASESYEKQLEKNTKGFHQLERRAKSFSDTHSYGLKMNADLWERLQTLIQRLGRNDISDLQAAMKEFDDIQTQAYREGLTSLDGIAKGMREVGRRMYTAFAIQAVDVFRQYIDTTKESIVGINDKLYEMKVITQDARVSFETFAKSAIESAQDVKGVVIDLMGMANTYARLGYEMAESLSMAESTTMYVNVSGADVENAQKAVTATVKAFEDEITHVNEALDKFVAVGNRFPISAAEIGEGMTNAAAALQASGNSLDQSIAILTAANQITQNASISSTAVRTIAARIRNSTAELEALGESVDDLVGGVAAYQEEILLLSGVDILQDDGETFKSTYQILDELAGKWKDLSDTAQASIVKIIGGTRQYNVVSSMLNNWSTAQEALNASLESSGTLVRSQGIYAESITASLNENKAAWDGLVASVTNGDLYKNFIDLTTGIFNVLSALDGLLAETALVNIAGLAIISQLHNIKGVGQRFISNLNDTKKTLTDVGKSLHRGYLGLVDFFTGLGRVKDAAKAANIALGATAAAIALLIHLYNAFKIDHEEISKASLSADDLISTRESLSDIKNEYKRINASVSDEEDKIASLTALQDELNSLLGEQKAGVDLVNGSYEEQLNMLKSLDEIERSRWLRENERGIRDAERLLGGLHSVGDADLLRKYGYEGNLTSRAIMGTTPNGEQQIIKADYQATMADLYEFAEKAYSEALRAGDEYAMEQFTALLNDMGASDDYLNAKELLEKKEIIVSSFETIGESAKQSMESAEDAFKIFNKELSKNELTKVASAIETVVNSTKKLKNAITDLNDGKMSIDSINDLLSLDNDEINKALSDYITGLATVSETQKALISAKNKMNEEAYWNVVKMSNAEIKTLASAYKIDLNNCTSYENFKVQLTSDASWEILGITEEWVKQNANAYGVDAENYAKNQEAKLKMSQAFIKEEIKRYEGLMKTALTHTIADAYYQKIQELKAMLPNLPDFDKLVPNFDKIVSGSVSSGASSSKDEYLDKVNGYFDALKIMLDFGIITEEEYYAEVLALNEKYFKDKEKYLDEYRKHELEVYEFLRKQEEERIEGLKDNMSAAQNAVIKVLEDEIALLEKQNEETEKGIELEKARMALAEAKRNKKIIYRDGVGFVYEADQSAIDEAQKEVDRITQENELEQRKSFLEEYKQQWENFESDYEAAQDALMAEQILGAEWEEKILEGRLDVVEAFRDKYVALMKGTNVSYSGDWDSILPDGILSFTGKNYPSASKAAQESWNKLVVQHDISEINKIIQAYASGNLKPAITIHQGNITIQGAATEITVEKIKQVIEEENEKTANELLRSMYKYY